MKRPRTSVKKEQKIRSQPWSLSQPLFMGRASAGRERRKVKNMTTAFTTPAVSGHWKSKRSKATLFTFLAPRSCCSLTRQKPSSIPPQMRNIKSTLRKVSMSLFMMTVGDASKATGARFGLYKFLNMDRKRM